MNHSLFICRCRKYDSRASTGKRLQDRPARRRMLWVVRSQYLTWEIWRIWEPTSRKSLSKSVQVNSPIYRVIYRKGLGTSWVGASTPKYGVGSLEVQSGLNSNKVFRVGQKARHIYIYFWPKRSIRSPGNPKEGPSANKAKTDKRPGLTCQPRG